MNRSNFKKKKKKIYERKIQVEKKKSFKIVVEWVSRNISLMKNLETKFA